MSTAAVATQEAAEAVKAAHGDAIRAVPGTFSVGVQRRSPDDYVVVAFVDRSHPVPATRTIEGVEVLFRHEDRLVI